MYVDKKRKSRLVPVLVSAVLMLAGIWYFVMSGSGEAMGEESAGAMRAAVERCAMQCYVVEGAYPPGLSYLEEHYGLRINRREFLVSYEVFASNVPPTVKVISRSGRN